MLMFCWRFYTNNTHPILNFKRLLTIGLTIIQIIIHYFHHSHSQQMPVNRFTADLFRSFIIHTLQCSTSLKFWRIFKQIRTYKRLSSVHNIPRRVASERTNQIENVLEKCNNKLISRTSFIASVAYNYKKPLSIITVSYKNMDINLFWIKHYYFQWLKHKKDKANEPCTFILMLCLIILITFFF